MVRSGLLTPAETYAEVCAAIAQDHPDLPAERTAQAWVEQADAEWRAEADRWRGETDHDRLSRVFSRLEQQGVVVLQGCADHWAAKTALEGRSPRPAGVAWFTAPDVWHAIDAGMLEVNLWHPSTANAAPGDTLLDDVLTAFAVEGLSAHFDEGRIEVAAHWQRRPPPG